MRYLLHDVFLRSVETYPKRVAVQMEQGESVTYEEMNILVNQFACVISKVKKEVRSKPFVGILSPVHIQSIACVLGTLKIGCAYVPLDEHSPTKRLVEIIKRTKLEVLCVDSHVFEKHKGLLKLKTIKQVIFLNEGVDLKKVKRFIPGGVFSYQEVLKSPSIEPPILNQVSDDLAYVLHSSGSTGVPKGIMLTHRNARTFIDWMQKEFKLTKLDIVMSRAPFKFDLSVFDIFNTFNAGAKLVCYDWNNERESPQRHYDYVQLMKKSKATILYTTPSTFISLMNKGNLSQQKLFLRTLMYAGEPFPVPQLQSLKKAVPQARIANIYGPTETNIITYWWIDHIPKNATSIPLGHVVEDTEILIVSEDGKRICEPDEVGELWCRGGTVTLGYLGMSEKTKEQFVQSPFHPFPAWFWRTGDYGFCDKKGILHYRGRKDHMVKVRGFRIELGEIESALAKHKRLDEFCVVAIPDEKYGNKLICFYSLLENHSFLESDLITFLKRFVPSYMIPFRCIEKKVLPKTSSGKIDRVGLSQEYLDSSEQF